MRAATIDGSAKSEGETSLYTVRVRGLKGAVVGTPCETTCGGCRARYVVRCAKLYLRGSVRIVRLRVNCVSSVHRSGAGSRRNCGKPASPGTRRRHTIYQGKEWERVVCACERAWLLHRRWPQGMRGGGKPGRGAGTWTRRGCAPPCCTSGAASPPRATSCARASPG